MHFCTIRFLVNAQKSAAYTSHRLFLQNNQISFNSVRIFVRAIFPLTRWRLPFARVRRSGSWPRETNELTGSNFRNAIIRPIQEAGKTHRRNAIAANRCGRVRRGWLVYARNFGSHPFNGTESTRLNSTNTNQLLARRKLSDSFDLFFGSLILRTRIKFSLMPLLSKVDFPTSFFQFQALLDEYDIRHSKNGMVIDRILTTYSLW